MAIRGMIYASMFGALTAAGAYMAIPLPLVPMTLQTLFLNLASGLLGGPLGALSQIIYLILGIIGLPVFAGGKAGLGILLGPTGGYLIGFVFAAYVIGRMVTLKKRPGFLWIVLSMVLGIAVIYLFGLAQLSVVADLSLIKALAVGTGGGLYVFGDLVKIIVAAVLTLNLRERIKIKD
jgi:biotin transport system substrate-specific component